MQQTQRPRISELDAFLPKTAVQVEVLDVSGSSDRRGLSVCDPMRGWRCDAGTRVVAWFRRGD